MREPEYFITCEHVQIYMEKHVTYESNEQLRRQSKKNGPKAEIRALLLPPSIYTLWQAALSRTFARWAAKTMVPIFDPIQKNRKMAEPQPYSLDKDQAETLDSGDIRLFSAKAESACENCRKAAEKCGRAKIHFLYLYSLSFESTGSSRRWSLQWTSTPHEDFENNDAYKRIHKQLTEETGGWAIWHFKLHPEKFRNVALGMAVDEAINEVALDAKNALVNTWREAREKRVIQQALLDRLGASPTNDRWTRRGRRLAAAPVLPMAAVSATVPVFPGLEKVRELVKVRERLVSEPLVQMLQERYVFVFCCSSLIFGAGGVLAATESSELLRATAQPHPTSLPPHLRFLSGRQLGGGHFLRTSSSSAPLPPPHLRRSGCPVSQLDVG